MKKIIFLFFILYGEISGQGIDNRWVFGYSCCAGNFGATDLDFSSGAVNIILKQRYMNFLETNGIISCFSSHVRHFFSKLFTDFKAIFFSLQRRMMKMVLHFRLVECLRLKLVLTTIFKN